MIPELCQARQDGQPKSPNSTILAGASAGGINTLLASLNWAVKPEKDDFFTNSIKNSLAENEYLDEPTGHGVNTPYLDFAQGIKNIGKKRKINPH